MNRWIVLFIMAVVITSCSTGNYKPTYSKSQDKYIISNQDDSTSKQLVKKSSTLLGTSYKYGGSTPSTGFDCSGLVAYVYKDVVGVELPHNAKSQSQLARYVGQNPDDFKAGDLVLFNGFSHVGIYIGNNQFINAPSSGGKVRIDKLDAKYWQQNFNGGYTYFEK